MNDQEKSNSNSLPIWFSGDNKFIWVKWTTALIVLFVSPVYLYLKPDDYTPIVEVLLNLILFFLAFWVGEAKEAEKAARDANKKWVPQAESVIYRLITLHDNVKRFAKTSGNSCDKTKCDLPELDKEELKAVRIKIQSDCESTSERLIDISRQLEDAIGDWNRFIAANCDGDECGRIFDEISSRKTKLEEESKEALQKSIKPPHPSNQN